MTATGINPSKLCAIAQKYPWDPRAANSNKQRANYFKNGAVVSALYCTNPALWEEVLFSICFCLICSL